MEEIKSVNMNEAIGSELRSEEEEGSSLSDYYVKIEAFEGPFDLLLHLINEGKVDIYAVSLDQITKGYLDYLKLLKELNIVVASEFLLMAAFLLEMKSRALLPKEEQPAAEESLEELESTLLERLFEYKMFKGLAEKLKRRKEVFQNAYSRYSLEVEGTFDEEREIFLTDVTLKDLIYAFKKVWDVVEARGEVREIAEEHITVGERIKEILDRIKGRKSGLPFEEMFTRFTKLEVIVTFLAILELAKQRAILIRQGENFGSILIFGRKEIG
ncbi:MAG: segregation/condensation protein A [Candidatus Saganbacteria bacterium]|nr:segregation/condensation protein A [Candidatus Saganbacteria bacterium]